MMKDAYSFGTEEQFKDVYQQMWDAYKSIFEDVGLKVDVVAADNGYIGGEYCHEFVAESEAGESRYFIDEKSGYAAHEDVATFQIEDKNITEELQALQEVEGVRGTTMQDGVALHGLPLWQQTKDVLYFDEPTRRYILAVIRGDFEVNETKLMQACGAWDLRAATDEEIRDDLDSEPGFISPVNMLKKGKKTGYEVVIVGDTSLRTVRNMYGGANQKNKDLLNINIDRDFKPDIEADIALAQAGWKSPEGGTLVEKRGIEVGNIFQLGYHYTNLMQDAAYTNASGNREKYYMGCYGIGVGRTLAAVVEVNHDDKGIIWPYEIAPYKVYLAPVGRDDSVMEHAERLYKGLTDAGIEVLYDDRDVRPGEKFADADLMGIPYRVVVSMKTIADDKYEVKSRTDDKAQFLEMQSLIKMVAAKAA